ncbi:triphosphoribosyl-dephospho-CoA synthase [Halalkalicoccus ordinarius]|uniref:triphosphoribosyl-dephospho-CoA synthase n=1 Tax=Halalkalicoccus ordinarius TaxID=3116651 RepID=UPI00300F4A87
MNANTSARTRTAAQNAELALLLEVAGTPKPGNVDRRRDLSDLRFEQFLAGAVGAGEGLRDAEAGDPIGEAFERAVGGMAAGHGQNTQFGALLLLVPLVRAAIEDGGTLSPEGVRRVVEATTVEDAAAFYRAFEYCEVFVDDPPEDAADLDVRRGSEAVPALERRGLTLLDVMRLSEAEDDVAREWTGGFERSFRAAELITESEGPLSDRGARAFLDLLAERPDTLVAKKHGERVAEGAMERAKRTRDAGDPDAIEALAEAFVEEGINPGTTADIVAAGLFVALERGVEP